jgi:hypothetical protein
MTHIPKISKDLIGKINSEDLAKVSHIVYKNRGDNPINTVYNFYKAVESAIKEIESIKKIAYPQKLDQGYFQAPHNLERWVQAMRKMYALRYKGLGEQEAFNKITEEWDTMEKRDFEHWLKFYENGDHLSYKLAAEKEKVYHDFGGSGPIPVGEFPKAKIPMASDQEEELPAQPSKKQKELGVKELKDKIIARLNSAEKLYASDPNFRNLLGQEYQAWLATLHNLKLKLQTAPIQNIATMEDLVVKFGNQLKAKGLTKTAAVIVKLAQEVAPPPVGTGGDIAPEMPPMDMPMEGMSEDGDPDAAMDEFMENLGAKPDKKKEEELEQDADDLVVSEEEYDLYKKAQEAPMPIASPVLPVPEKKEFNHPVSVKGDEGIENALKNITMQDVIIKLEGLTQLYKNRPLARELTVVDLMMDALGISSYFPNMAEATKSALDSNQYVLTRIEDVLAKLRGANAAETGQLDILKQKLEKSEENDSNKRQQREQANMTDQPAVPGAPPPVKAPELEAPVEVEAPAQPGVRV